MKIRISSLRRWHENYTVVSFVTRWSYFILVHREGFLRRSAAWAPLRGWTGVCPVLREWAGRHSCMHRNRMSKCKEAGNGGPSVTRLSLLCVSTHNFCSSMAASFCKEPDIKQLHGRVFPTLATLAKTYTGKSVTILTNVWHWNMNLMYYSHITNYYFDLSSYFKNLTMD